MITVELIYDTDCPNVREARTQLLRAFAKAGVPPKWKEWDLGVPENPAYVRAYGSPTILVNGQDVADAPPVVGDCCRLYMDKARRLAGVPSADAITSALLKVKDAASPDKRASVCKRNWRGSLAVFPGIGIALLPKLACPACWPAYSGLLSSLGLGFVNYTAYLLPLTVIFLALAVASLAYRAKNRGGYKPFILGILAAIIIIASKFSFVPDLAMYGGIALLMSATLWNSWPRRRANNNSCPACVSRESQIEKQKR
jgi:hypothetical protein